MFFLYVGQTPGRVWHKSEDYRWLVHYAAVVQSYKDWFIKDMDGNIVYSSKDFNRGNI
jgi:hypothetical protein